VILDVAMLNVGTSLTACSKAGSTQAQSGELRLGQHRHKAANFAWVNTGTKRRTSLGSTQAQSGELCLGQHRHKAANFAWVNTGTKRQTSRLNLVAMACIGYVTVSEHDTDLKHIVELMAR
jgi:hypothetical protein